MLKLTDYICLEYQISKIMAHGGIRATLTKQLKKGFHCYPTVFFFLFFFLFFQNVVKTHEEINIGIMNNT